MSTENEEWRENSFNEENAGAGRDGNRSYNREGGERPYRKSNHSPYLYGALIVY